MWVGKEKVGSRRGESRDESMTAFDGAATVTSPDEEK